MTDLSIIMLWIAVACLSITAIVWWRVAVRWRRTAERWEATAEHWEKLATRLTPAEVRASLHGLVARDVQ